MSNPGATGPLGEATGLLVIWNLTKAVPARANIITEIFSLPVYLAAGER